MPSLCGAVEKLPLDYHGARRDEERAAVQLELTLLPRREPAAPLDRERIAELVAASAIDAEIAERLRCHPGVVGRIRRELGLPGSLPRAS